MKRSTCVKLACGVVAALVVAAWCGEAAAQHFHHHGVVIGAPIVVRPVPVYRPVVVRSYPVYPVVYREPAVVYTSSNPAPLPVSVTLVNPSSTGTTLSFTIRGTRYELEPGARQSLHFGSPRTIEFDRGEGFGIARYALADGVFAFTATDHGWALRRWAD